MEKEESSKKKKKKGWTIFAIVLSGVLVLHFGGSFAAGFVVFHALYDKRQSSESDLSSIVYKKYKIRDDYENLKTRSIHHFTSGSNELTAYLYETDSPRGLVIAAHGLTSLSDGYDAAYQNYFLTQGYDVFAIDLTSSGQSQGKGISGLHQSAYDIAAAEDYLSTIPSLDALEVTLVGHSWGGYGCLASLALNDKPKKVIAFSAFDEPLSFMVDVATQYVGPYAYATYPTYALAAFCRFGSEATRSASCAVSQSNAEVFLAWGDADARVKWGSTAMKALWGNPRVENVIIAGVGHDTPWLDKEAMAYASAHQAEVGTANYDLEKSSVLNADLFDKISNFMHG